MDDDRWLHLTLLLDRIQKRGGFLLPLPVPLVEGEFLPGVTTAPASLGIGCRPGSSRTSRKGRYCSSSRAPQSTMERVVGQSRSRKASFGRVLPSPTDPCDSTTHHLREIGA